MTSGSSTEPSVDAAYLPALIAELASKSDLVWVTLPGGPSQALWNIWTGDAIAVVTGGSEQRDPGLAHGGTVEVILRSKENRARQLAIPATVEKLAPDSETWSTTAAALHPKRLNPPDGEAQPQRWARESTLWLLHPATDPVEQPGLLSDSAHRAEPVVTAATTSTRMPFHGGRATKKRRRR